MKKVYIDGNYYVPINDYLELDKQFETVKTELEGQLQVLYRELDEARSEIETLTQDNKYLIGLADTRLEKIVSVKDRLFQIVNPYQELIDTLYGGY